MITRRDLTVILSLLAVGALIAIERFLQPSYWIKSLIKAVIFLGCIGIYCWKFRENFFTVINLKKKKLSPSLIMFMILVYGFVIAGFFMLRKAMDLSMIKSLLLSKEHIDSHNFIFVFLYIIIFNSFLEEAFFRGFIVYGFGQHVKGIKAYSAAMFAIYHIGIISGWFLPFLIVFCIIGLFFAGGFLQLLCEKEDTLLASWLVHACANLAINTIGTIMILFY